MGARVRVLADVVRNVSVPALTVGALLARHVPSAVRYVQVDVEGWDDEVLYRLPLWPPEASRAFAPEVVTFEWMLLGVPRFEAAIRRLGAAGYDCCWEEQNVVGVRRVGE